ncbi:M1 family metallopeptidase [Fulvivirgaceae bacterium BMA10]|uniref:Aminopeptidase N n=1 Tax=Splendidivirga corallicola TaxID=3051826 RepID=A0ABT8KNF4_9BACT|nr:M1 family metallopeptidase [Fulvivirgaceae bacterium BMA10]
MKKIEWKAILSLSIFLSILYSCNQTKMNEEPSTEMMNVTINDPHSYAKPEEAVIKHLKWDVELDFSVKKINGVASLTIDKSESAKQLVLDIKGLNIRKVTLDDDPMEVTFSIGPEDAILGSPLQINILPETKIVHVHYTTGDNAEALQWLDPKQTAGGKHPFLFTQSQAILARSWIPLQDSPGIRFTYEATVKVPKELLALMSAANPQEKNETGIYEFKMDQAIPAYLMALSVGDIAFQSLGERTGVYAEPVTLKKAAYEFGELENMVKSAEELYGPYRWERYDIIVLPPSFPFGGMENPRLTFATPTILAGDRSLTSLVAHELAHSWSGNLVTNATWNDFWLNEGFTVYFEHRIMEALYGRDYSEMLASLTLQGLEDEVAGMMAEGKSEETKLKLDLHGRSPDDGMTAIAYDKGYFFLRYLEEQVGREKFDAFLKEYFASNAFKVMTTEQFVVYLNEHLLADIDANETLYDKWIYQIGLPKDTPSPVSDRFEKVDEVLTSYNVSDGPVENDLKAKTSQWSTHEWLHFVRNLPVELPIARMSQLDQAFNFTGSGNSEILAAWFIHVIRNKYEPGYKRLEDFLVQTGRRKFLTPLYGEMIKTEKGKAMALDIYKKARPNYHFVSTNTLDEMLGVVGES